MLQLTCFVGRLRNNIDFPFPLTLMNRTIQQYLNTGSLDASGQAHINMQVDEISRVNAGLINSDVPTNAVYLQQSLAAITQNPVNISQVRNVGVILADRYEHRPGLLGLMFDYGFNPSNIAPVTAAFRSVPREGCAIFLNAIRDMRGINSDFNKEVVFTAIHELGHVFNLGHINSPRNFMSTSDVSAVYPPTAYFFHKTHNFKLQRAETDEHVYPGGSNYDEGGPAGLAENDPFSDQFVIEDLTLKIHTNQEEFWHFEPVELDISIQSKSKKYILEDKVDPGYENLIIHINRPDGTIFKYRSPRIYCQNHAKITVKPGQPFLRDISIFGQSGGYTFSTPGEYKIRAVFKSGRNVRIISNTLSINVKAIKPFSQKFSKMETLLSHHDIARLLYHRSGKYRKSSIVALEAFARSQSRTELGNNVLYALAKFMVHRNKKLSTAQKNKLSYTIKQIQDSGKLSHNKLKNLKNIS